jgi:predicted ArsR family transcriptional regulator
MTAPGEVKFNVRHNVLLLKVFTIPQLESVTGLNRHSITTEVKRMEKEGMVSRVGAEAREKGSAGGRPPVIYQLTSDPEKRFELLQSVRAFYIAGEGQAAELPRPESKHYLIAKEELEKITEAHTALTPAEKAMRLDAIKERLEYAKQAEDVGEEGTELIAASLDILEAEAIDMLADDWERAVALLDNARQVSKQHGAHDLVEEIQTYVRIITKRLSEKLIRLWKTGEYFEEVVQDLRIMQHRFSDLPEISTIVEIANLYATRMGEKHVEKVAVQQAQFTNALAQRQAILIVNTPVAAQEPWLEGWPLEERGSVKPFSPERVRHLLRGGVQQSDQAQLSTLFFDLARRFAEVQESEI